MQAGSTEASGGERKAATERDKEKGRWEGGSSERGSDSRQAGRQAELNHTFFKEGGWYQAGTHKLPQQE